jgi:long-chain acyl-CoA synthetase
MHPKTSDVITVEQADTLPGLFRERLKRDPEKAAYRHYHPHKQHWEDITWRQTARAVARIQAALVNESLAPGDRVAIMMRNCPLWVQFEQAALGLGLVVVPLFTNDRTDNIAYVLQDAGVKVLLIEGLHQLRELEGIASQIEGLVRLLSAEPCKEYNRFSRLLTVDEWLEGVPAEVDETQLQTKESAATELATIVYTSGTTGRPKGVMLSHRNILSNACAGVDAISCYHEDVFLSFLPLSHMLERTVGYYVPMVGGALVAFARSVKDLPEDLQTQRPTILVSVPRIYERFYNKICAQLEEKSALSRNLFNKAVDVGWDRFQHPDRPHLAWPILKALVASKVCAKLGGRLRLAICGGARLSPLVSKTFIGLGLQLLQGYGLTETSPIIAANRERINEPSSVGPALKEIIVLSNGEKVPPNDMELTIAMDPLLEQVMVLGEGKPYLSALAVLNPDQWQNLRDSLEMSGDHAAALASETAQSAVLKKVWEQIKGFPGYAQIQRIALTLEPWTVENGLITPTLKLKRERIMERYADIIDGLYAGHASPNDAKADTKTCAHAVPKQQIA